ncbi:MAG: hypothetical protein QX189_18260 [Methylococcales bacterium]
MLIKYPTCGASAGYVTSLQCFDCDVVLNIMPEFKRSWQVE